MKWLKCFYFSNSCRSNQTNHRSQTKSQKHTHSFWIFVRNRKSFWGLHDLTKTLSEKVSSRLFVCHVTRRFASASAFAEESLVRSRRLWFRNYSPTWLGNYLTCGTVTFSDTGSCTADLFSWHRPALGVSAVGTNLLVLRDYLNLCSWKREVGF